MRKYLKIAVTVIFVSICLLFTVLWVRSYIWRDMIWARNPDVGSAYVMTLQGKLRASLFREQRHSPSDFSLWGANSAPARRMAADLERSPMPNRVSAFGFELVNFPNPFAFAVPLWFAILMSAGAASLPWIKWRFGIRTMLLGTTLVAAVLSWAAFAARK